MEAILETALETFSSAFSIFSANILRQHYLQDFTKTEACNLNSSEVKTGPFKQLT
jgi:hypothetical protein